MEGELVWAYIPASWVGVCIGASVEEAFDTQVSLEEQGLACTGASEEQAWACTVASVGEVVSSEVEEGACTEASWVAEACTVASSVEEACSCLVGEDLRG